MSTPIIITPTWRGGEPFVIYRNPTSRERRELMRGDQRTVRFILAGDGSLLVGNAFEFLHFDSHTGLRDTFGANPYWSGTLTIAGPRFPISYAGRLAPNVAEDDPRNVWAARHAWNPAHVEGEYNERGDVVLGRIGHYHLRQRGILDRSQVWQNFTRGLRIGFEPIAPLPLSIVDRALEANERALVILHDDGHFYRFPYDSDLWRADSTLRPGEAILGLRFGGNGNVEIVFSEVSQPLDFIASLAHPMGNCLIEMDVTHRKRETENVPRKAYGQSGE